MRSQYPRFACVWAGALLALAITPAAGEDTTAAPEARSVTYSVNGQEVTRYFEYRVTEDGTVRLVETTGPGGQVVTSATTATKTATGATSSTTVTGPNNKAATSNTEWMMNEMGYTKVTTATGPNDKSATSTTTASRTGDGSATLDKTIQGANGKTASSTSTGGAAVSIFTRVRLVNSGITGLFRSAM